MPASKAEQVLEALRASLATVPGASVERTSAVPPGRASTQILAEPLRPRLSASILAICLAAIYWGGWGMAEE